jgi:hypothetical protein
MDIPFEFSGPQLSGLLCMIVLALIPLTIWACRDIDQRRLDRSRRRRLQRLSARER